jgi:alpha-1,3-glucan synthase
VQKEDSDPNGYHVLMFRWPAIKNGTKYLLRLFTITLLFPGIPTISWGEEEAVYVLESTNDNYVFGRAPMASSRAWEIHGCYAPSSVKYANFPLNKGIVWL